MLRTPPGPLPTAAGWKGESYLPDPREDVPFHCADLTHGRSYSAFKDGLAETFVAPDRIGARPLSIHFGNYCHSTCVFCSLKRNTQAPPSGSEVLQILEKYGGSFDSINFDSSDFLHDHGAVHDLLAALAENPAFIRLPKKITACVRSVGDGEILREMADKGFGLIAFGIESFDDAILERLKKQSTRAENRAALDAALEAGMRPGMNLILYTPWDTVATTVDTIRTALDYLERGAYANVVAGINVIYGTQISKRPELLEYRICEGEGLLQPLKIPYQGRVLDPELRGLMPKALQWAGDLEKDYPRLFADTVAVYSLLLMKGFFMALKDAKGGTAWDGDIARLDAVIERNIRSMLASVADGAVGKFSPADYPQIRIPGVEEHSSLRTREYICSKFPEELLRAVQEKRAQIEIHRGPLSATQRWLAAEELRGREVQELFAEKPRIRRYYRLTDKHDGACCYVIANNIGYNRELFVTQTLKHFEYPADRVALRIFPADMRAGLLAGLQEYAGAISRVIIAHETADLLLPALQAADPELLVRERIRNDYMSGEIVETSRGEMLLLWDIEYLNGEQIFPALEFITASTLRRGLGVRDVAVFAACGTLSEAAALGDLIMPHAAHDYTSERVVVRNALDLEALRPFLPETSIHQAALFSLPTVLNGGKAELRQIRDQEECAAIDLECVHVARAAALHRDAAFRVLYEVHDRPAVAPDENKVLAIGQTSLGMESRAARGSSCTALVNYLLENWERERVIRCAARAAGTEAFRLPPVFSTRAGAIKYLMLESAVDEMRESCVVFGAAGLCGTGKSYHLSPALLEALSEKYGSSKVCFIEADRFVLPKEARPLQRRNLLDILDLDRLLNTLQHLKHGGGAVVPLYDPIAGRRPALAPEALAHLLSVPAAGVQLPPGWLQLPPPTASLFQHLKTNSTSRLIAHSNGGEVAEYIEPGKQAAVVAHAALLSVPRLRELLDYSAFCWASREARRAFLQMAADARQRCPGATPKQIEARLKRFVKEDDPLVYTGIEFANCVFANC